MLTYRNEAAFSKALVTAMRNKGIFVQRIESGETGKGIPDLFVITKGTPMWVELKRIHGDIPMTPMGTVVVTWRPGQRAWLSDVDARGVTCCTIACFNNGILKIQHDQLWYENKVWIQMPGVHYYRDIKELLA